MSSSLRPHGLQPSSLLRPWDFPGKGTGVDCHFLLHWCFFIQSVIVLIFIWFFRTLCNLYKPQMSIPPGLLESDHQQLRGSQRLTPPLQVQQTLWCSSEPSKFLILNSNSNIFMYNILCSNFCHWFYFLILWLHHLQKKSLYVINMSAQLRSIFECHLQMLWSVKSSGLCYFLWI